ncbi:MAG TPA: ABC transporter permease [Candidatus Acidoferrum sp.]
MNWLGEWARRLHMLLHRRQFDAELREEMRLHLELRQEEQLQAGIKAEDARAAVRRRFGNTAYLSEESHLAWGWEWLETLVEDVHYALRTFSKSPGFTAVVVLTLALGTGATTAMFSVVDATLLRPLPYPQPQQLVSIQDDLPGVGGRDVGMSEPEWQALENSGIFEHVSPTWFDENNLTGSSEPARVRLLIVAPNYFALLGVEPQLGRAFHPKERGPGLLGEVVISDGLWKRAFGSDPNILRKSVRLDTDLYRIIGVMPADFDAPGRTAEERNIEVWAATNFYGAPMPDEPPRNRRNLPTAVARLKAGLTIGEAQSRLDALVLSLQEQFPSDYPLESAWTVRLVPLHQRVVGNVRQSLVLLFSAVGLVLLIGCVNVANLLLARASRRGREMAVRQALGAGRHRLLRQLLTESVILSLLGGIAGLAILLSLRHPLLRLLPENFPRLNDISISWTVLLFALVASLATGAIFGLAPALETGRIDLTHALKEATRSSTGSGEQARRRGLLVVTEFALSLVLMTAAGLLLHSFWDLLKVRLGFRTQNVMAVRTRLPDPNDPRTDRYRNAREEGPFLREVVRRVGTLPGVEEVAVGDTASIPLDRSQRELKVISEGQFFVRFEGRDTPGDQPAVVERSSVTPDYFHLLGIPLLGGRWFSELDDDTRPQVAVVNEAFARTYWPGRNPVGKRFESTRAGSPWVTVVGIIANARTESLENADVPQIYLNLYQASSHRLAIFLRGHLDTGALPEKVREEVQSVDPRLPVFGAQTLGEALSASLAERRFAMEIVGVFALTALFLSGLGIYGVISYLVSERTHEIGIRLALGAQERNILSMVLRQGFGLAVSGAGVGLVGALIVSRLMAGVLYGVRPADPPTFAGVTLLLILVALFACYIPARRALRVDPAVALRHE